MHRLLLATHKDRVFDSDKGCAYACRCSKHVLHFFCISSTCHNVTFEVLISSSQGVAVPSSTHSMSPKQNPKLGKRNDCLGYAVALQDHLSRTYQLPGSQKLPSCAPGAVPTLAQRIGLFPAPEKLLTPDEWETVHGLARQRTDHTHQCSICLEPFKEEQQVLLSCSHVFHTQCLASFEKYVKIQACPLCRKQWYQKLIITDAAEAYRHVCATRIQAAVRSWLCRKHLHLSELRHAPPKACRLKRQWAAGRLCEAGQALIALQQNEQDSLEELFQELDAGRRAAEQVFTHSVAMSRVSRQANHTSVCQSGGDRGSCWGCTSDILHSRDGSPGTDGRQSGTGSSATDEQGQTGVQAPSAAALATAGRSCMQTGHTGAGGIAAIDAQYMADASPALQCDADWSCVVSRACERAETECAICLLPLARREHEGLALLSCSHVFHMQCVMFFEHFETGRGGKASCPVCRAGYSRKCFAASCTVAPAVLTVVPATAANGLNVSC